MAVVLNDVSSVQINGLVAIDQEYKPESENPQSGVAVAQAVAEHNADTQAHPALLVTLSSLESRLTTLELKYDTDVTGNPFEVTFANLDGLIVTGVWNETYARVEF